MPEAVADRACFGGFLYTEGWQGGEQGVWWVRSRIVEVGVLKDMLLLDLDDIHGGHSVTKDGSFVS